MVGSLSAVFMMFSGVADGRLPSRRASRARLRSVDRRLNAAGGALCRSGSARWSADGADLSARSATAIKRSGAVGFEATYAGALRHLEPLKHGAGLGIDASQFALVAVPHAVPQLAVDPGHTGYELVG